MEMFKLCRSLTCLKATNETNTSIHWLPLSKNQITFTFTSANSYVPPDASLRLSLSAMHETISSELVCFEASTERASYWADNAPTKTWNNTDALNHRTILKHTTNPIAYLYYVSVVLHQCHSPAYSFTEITFFRIDYNYVIHCVQHYSNHYSSSYIYLSLDHAHTMGRYFSSSLFMFHR